MVNPTSPLDLSGVPDEERNQLEAFLGALVEELPVGWIASVQLEDPLTHTLEEIASTHRGFDTRFLALAPLPEGFTRPPDRWLLERMRLGQAAVIPLAGERYFGRVLLAADDDARPLDEHRAEALRTRCREASPQLERLRAHHEDAKFSARLRHMTEIELAERFTRASLGLLPTAKAVALLVLRAGDLTVLRVRRHDGTSLEEYIRQTLPFEGSHIAAIARGQGRDIGSRLISTGEGLERFSEGKLFAPLLETLGIHSVETMPLEPGGRLAGSLMLFYAPDEPPGEERVARRHLARALSAALDRIRPERRQASSLLYLQELLRTAEGGLMPTLQTVVEEFVRFLGADAGVLALIDSNTGNLLVSQPVGYGRKAVFPDVLPLDDALDTGTPRGGSISAQVVRTGKPYVAEDTQSSSFYMPIDNSIRSEIAVPLRLHGDTVGVAVASSHTPDFFRTEDAPRFQLFADQIAVAIDNAHLLDNLRQQRERRLLTRQRRTFGFHPSLHAEDVQYHFGNLVGNPDGAFGEVYRAIERVADRDNDTVLIIGETGSGKEMISHALHNVSQRRSHPLVATNFAALGGDPNLIQSELFGHEKGSFTGAVRRRLGCFEKAHRSTLLIDELGDIVPSVQVKLLRVLGRSSRREFSRLGGEEPVTCDVRVLAATNKDLQREVAEGRFREDLYYRLSSLVIRIPPLRRRPEDIPLLTRHFLARLADGEVRLGRSALQSLEDYHWPGNVRQLESVLLRALVMFGAPDELTAEDIRQALALEQGLLDFDTEVSALVCPDPAPVGWFWQEVWEPWKNRRLTGETVRGLLVRHLQETGGYYSRVAERLGVEKRDYQRFLDFLKHSNLKVDHRPYREGRSGRR